MPVDAQTQRLIEQLEAMEAPPIWEQSIDEAREAMRTMVTMMGEGEEVLAVEDTAIPGPAALIPIRLYRPRDAPSPRLPVLVFYHGGGFVLGDLDTHDRDCRALANRASCLVAAVDYRLAPEAPFPAAVDDACAALAWVAEHAAELGGDGARLAVGGDSAGGNLAAVVALWARDRGIALRFQLLIYPGVDVEGEYPSRLDNAEGYLLDQPSIDWFVQQYVGDTVPDDWRFTPMRASSHAGVAPALVITAEYDPLRDEGEAYAAKLTQAGVEARATRFEGMIHGFFSMAPIIDAAAPAVDEAGAALKAALWR